jgi:sigma-54 interacting transcriptional regulator/FHA domain-containing protein
MPPQIHRSNAVVIPDRFISSRHLQVTRTEAGFHVRDLNSTNGTYLDGVRVFEVELPLNGVLRVGQTKLVFERAAPNSQEPSFHGLVGRDPAMRELVKLLQQLAPSSATVLVQGESGTGKDVAAWALHECSLRSGKPFIPVNCAALEPASPAVAAPPGAQGHGGCASLVPCSAAPHRSPPGAAPRGSHPGEHFSCSSCWCSAGTGTPGGTPRRAGRCCWCCLDSSP